MNLGDTTLVRRSAYDPKSGQEYLPPMPERRHLLRTDEEDEIEKLARPRDTSLIGRMKDAVGWLFGQTAYEGVKERPDSIYKQTGLEKEFVFVQHQEDEWILPTCTSTKAAEDAVSSAKATWNPLSAISKWFWGEQAQHTAPDIQQSGNTEQSTPMLGITDRDGDRFDPEAYAYDSPFASNPLHPDYRPSAPTDLESRSPSFTSHASTSVAAPPPHPQYKSPFNGLIGSRARMKSDDSCASGRGTPYDPSPAMCRLEATHNLAGVGVTSAFTEHIDSSPPRPPPKIGMYTHHQPNQANIHRSPALEESGHTRLGSAELALRDDYIEYEGDSLVIDDDELDAMVDRGGQLAAHHRRPSGSVVYIRMSDGRLVRKLSTILSEREITSRETSTMSLSPSASGRGAVTSGLPGGW